METKLLFEWWNLVFVIPFCGGLLFLLIQTLGLSGDGDHDFDHDLDHDLDTDADHDADHDHDAESSASEDSIFWRATSVLGIGHVPISIVLMTLCFVWGFSGFTLNSLLHPLLRTPLLFLPLSMFAALIISFTVTGFVSRIVSKVMPKTSTYCNVEEDLVNQIGEALYSIDSKNGTVRVRDNFDNLQQYPAFTGANEEIPSGTRVLLVAFDRDKGAFEVTSMEKQV